MQDQEYENIKQRLNRVTRELAKLEERKSRAINSLSGLPGYESSSDEDSDSPFPPINRPSRFEILGMCSDLEEQKSILTIQLEAYGAAQPGAANLKEAESSIAKQELASIRDTITGLEKMEKETFSRMCDSMPSFDHTGEYWDAKREHTWLLYELASMRQLKHSISRTFID